MLRSLHRLLATKQHVIDDIEMVLKQTTVCCGTFKEDFPADALSAVTLLGVLQVVSHDSLLSRFYRYDGLR